MPAGDQHAPEQAGPPHITLTIDTIPKLRRKVGLPRATWMLRTTVKAPPRQR
jgi:hypothetical protein